jgi:hypothetical protein
MWRLSATTAAVLLGLAAGCDIDVKDEGELPDVQVEGGRLPDVDMRGPEIDVHREEKEIDVPTDIDVKTEKRTIPVPDVDITIPKENENE